MNFSQTMSRKTLESFYFKACKNLMKRNYYFLAASLPPLQIGSPLDLGFHAFISLLKFNLSDSDFIKITILRRYYDIQNIRAFWLNENQDARGNLNEKELEEALLTEIGLPQYVYDFLEKYERLEDRLHFFSSLVHAYFYHETENADDFLKSYLNFEREWRLVLTGFRAKLYGRDLSKELQFEDPSDGLVQHLLAQKDANSYDPPSCFSDLRALFENNENRPLDLHLALCEYRFHKIEDMRGIDEFSTARILAYAAQLIIAEKWLELDKNKGVQKLRAIVKD